MKNLLLSGMCLLLCASTGCASLQSVSVTNIPRERGRPVQATEDNVAFLGLHFNNNFADGLPDDLRSQCPNGKVTGIYSKYESTWYVLFQNRSVTAKGYCVSGEPRVAPAAPVTPPVLITPVVPVPSVVPAPAPQALQ